MHRKELVALVTGASVGVGGGALGAFLAWIAGEAVARRFLDQLGDQYIELAQPVLPAARHGAQRASPDSASETPPSGVPPRSSAKVAVPPTWQAADGQMAVPGNRR
jgi:hypothetical protein